MVAGKPWKVLVAENDEQILMMTPPALSRFEFQGQKLEFLFTRTGAEAKKVLAKNPDIAIVILDIVMESEQTGYEIIDFIPDELDNHITQILVRTDHRVKSPLKELVIKYEINDYKEKDELASEKFHIAMVCLHRAYSTLERL